MPIPGDNRGRLPVVYRVVIGEVRESGGKTYPSKLDHFKLKRRSQEGGKHWVTDEGLQAKVANGFDDWSGRHWKGYGPKPQSVPVVLFSDNPEDVLVSGLAWYGAGRRFCWATEFLGVDWGDEQAPAHCQLARYEKPKNMTDADWKVIKAYHHSKGHLCKPLSCPNYQWPTAAYKCKRFAVLRFILPFAPTVSGVAEFRTTGKASCIALENSVRRFQAELDGMLAGVPLILVMQPYSVLTPEGKQQTQWEVRLDYPAELGRFRVLAAESMEKRRLEEGRLRQIAAGYRALPAWTEESAREATEHAREFAPQAEDLPQADPYARFEGYADALQWLPGQRRAVLERFEGDMDAAADHAEEEYQRMIGEPVPSSSGAEPEPEPEAEDPEGEPEEEPAPERDEDGLAPEDTEPPEDAPTEGEGEEWHPSLCGECGGPVSDKMMDDFHSGRVSRLLKREVKLPLCSSCANAEANAAKGASA